MAQSYDQVEITSAVQLHDWLQRHHASSPGIWLVTYKKGRGSYVSYDDIVCEALAFGWIDSLPRKLDDDRSQLLLTPRKLKSNWSRVNKKRVERLVAEGRMQPAGLAMVELAKASGTWAALDDIENLDEPPELAASLNAVPAARSAWDAFPRSAKRGILEWIANAKADATRQKRIVETVSEAKEGRRANQWRQPKTF